jgi:hydroxymethylglutaryl-CoA lyase
VDTKALLIARLARHGFTTIEAGSFVSPKVKQMANTSNVLLHPAVRAASASSILQLLVPNKRGLDSFFETIRQAKEDGGSSKPAEISVFAAATENFSRANLNATVAEALDRLGGVAQEALSKGIRVRGYVSCAVGVRAIKKPQHKA